MASTLNLSGPFSSHHAYANFVHFKTIERKLLDKNTHANVEYPLYGDDAIRGWITVICCVFIINSFVNLLQQAYEHRRSRRRVVLGETFATNETSQEGQGRPLSLIHI